MGVNNHFYLNVYWMTNIFCSRLLVFFYFSTCGLLFPFAFLFLTCPFFIELAVFNGLYDVYVSFFGVFSFDAYFIIFPSSFSTYIFSFLAFSSFFPYSIINFVNTVYFSLASAKLDSFASTISSDALTFRLHFFNGMISKTVARKVVPRRQ